MRIQPQMPVHLYKSYRIVAPLKTHWRPASCEEAGCLQYQKGWKTTVDESTPLGQNQAHYIRHDKTRKCSEQKLPTGLTEFTFGPGQTCFGSDKHVRRIERPEHFLEQGGDFRGNPRNERRVHTRPDDWLDSFANHQDTLSDKFNQG